MCFVICSVCVRSDRKRASGKREQQHQSDRLLISIDLIRDRMGSLELGSAEWQVADRGSVASSRGTASHRYNRARRACVRGRAELHRVFAVVIMAFDFNDI